MGFNYMKKIILVLMMCLFVVGRAFAQSNMEGMRFLTINALLQYGQKLYDRGDFDEATAVFNHVLVYDNHQSEALKYLKSMGHLSVIKPLAVPQNKILVIKSADQIVNTVDVSDTEGLKKAIEAKKKSIEKLRVQIMQMRSKMAAQSAN